MFICFLIFITTSKTPISILNKLKLNYFRDLLKFPSYGVSNYLFLYILIKLLNAKNIILTLSKF